MLQSLLQSRPVVQPEQARRWDETLKSEDEDDTPDIGLRAHSMDDYTPGLSGLEQARRWGETYNGQREADTPDIGPHAHSINGSTPGRSGPRPLLLHMQDSTIAFAPAHLPRMQTAPPHSLCTQCNRPAPA